MYLRNLQVLFVLFTFALAQDTNLRTVKNAFKAANIPADIRITFNPSALLEVTFPQATSAPITLHAGIQLPRNATVGPPRFSVVGETVPASRKFVVAAVDPDAPTPQSPTEAQIRHFLGGDFSIIGNALRNSTPAISNFLQPTPPAGSDPHRYIFLLFNQPRGFDAQTFVTPATSTAGFNISQFAAEAKLGEPIAGTFMLVGPDPST